LTPQPSSAPLGYPKGAQEVYSRFEGVLGASAGHALVGASSAMLRAVGDQPRYHHTWRPHKPENASPQQKDLGWKVVNAASVAVAAIVVQRLLSMAWRLVRHQPPPSGPGDRRVTWPTALSWAASMGVGIAVSRVVAVRLSGKAWEAAVHEPPPEARP
jgi:Protein of unknown function (DUF4235)